MTDRRLQLWGEIVGLVRAVKELDALAIDGSGIRCERAGVHLLGTLVRLGPVRLTDLAASLGLDASSVSRQVAALERRRWVSREADPHDRRSSRLVLTDTGRAAADAVQETRISELNASTQTWSAKDVTNLAVALAQLNADLATYLTAARRPELAV